MLCVTLQAVFTRPCSSLRPSRTFFISLPNCLVLFCSFPIPSLRKSSSSFLRLPRSFSSSKRVFTSPFKALSSFKISIVFLLELSKRSLVLCIASLKNSIPVFILFRSSRNNESVGTVCLSFRSCTSHCKLLIFSCNSLMAALLPIRNSSN